MCVFIDCMLLCVCILFYVLSSFIHLCWIETENAGAKQSFIDVQ